MAPIPGTFPIIHRFLGIGLTVAAAAFFGLRYRGFAPLSATDSATPVIAYTLSGVAVVLVAVALFVLKPRAPARLPGQSVEEYWSTAAVSERVGPVWFILEAAGMIASVGYFLTGEPTSAGAVLVAIATYWLYGPSVFANL
jgi:hypothetical protein